MEALSALNNILTTIGDNYINTISTKHNLDKDKLTEDWVKVTGISSISTSTSTSTSTSSKSKAKPKEPKDEGYVFFAKQQSKKRKDGKTAAQLWYELSEKQQTIWAAKAAKAKEEDSDLDLDSTEEEDSESEEDESESEDDESESEEESSDEDDKPTRMNGFHIFCEGMEGKPRKGKTLREMWANLSDKKKKEYSELAKDVNRMRAEKAKKAKKGK